VDFAEFRARALTEGLRYGEDRMVFLRELAQNSRDAGATRIGVSAFVEGNDVVVGFGDDGEGMAYEHARRYLFTLYASSKEKDARSAGRFGVGFWSVLLFDPSRIIIESLTESGDAWAVALDGELAQPRRTPCGLRTPGTRVTLRRTVQPKEADRLLVEIERALVRYCRYLRRNNRQGSPLPVQLNGKRIDEPFSVDGPCWLAFRDGSVEGVVGLGDRPRVELYARGLLVWRGTTLDELRYVAVPAEEATHPEGLAPVYVINGNQLSVTLERRAVVDDRALARVRRVARRRMRELVGRYLDGVSPRPMGERFVDWITGLVEDLRLASRLGPIALVTALVLALAGAGAFAYNARFGDWGGGGAAARPETAGRGSGASSQGAGVPAAAMEARLGDASEYLGPMVHPLGVAPRVPLEYSPPEPTLFRTRAVEEPHPGRGMVTPPPIAASGADAFRCAARCVSVNVDVAANPGFLVLPTPTGHRVENGSVWLGGRFVDRVLVTERGEPAIRLDEPFRGRLVYRTGPGSSYVEPARLEQLLEVPEAMRPTGTFGAVTRGAAAEPRIGARVEIIRAFVEQGIAYDRSASTVAAYRTFLDSDPRAGWIEFVTTLGRGDCDVKNALAVVMLRSAGVPARLALGVAGSGGRSLPGLHAWVEYYDGGWLQADATGAAPGGPDAGSPGLGVAPVNTPDTSVPPGPPPVDAAPFVDTVPVRPEVRPQWVKWVAVASAVVAGLAGILALALALVGRGQRKLVAPGGREVREKVAAEMLTGAIIQPEIWLRSGGLSSRKLLPVIGRSSKLSLAEALARGRKGRLWLSAERPGLVRRASRGGAQILDAADPSFGDLIARLPGVIDLDQIARLRPSGTHELPRDMQPAGQLIDEVDRLIGLAGRPERSVVPCTGLSGAICRDVDLSGLPLGRGSDLPTRFVAVCPSAAEVGARVRLGEYFPGLAAYLLLDLVLARSGLFRSDLEVIRTRAARDVIEVAR